jgi:hypothetical protein
VSFAASNFTLGRTSSTTRTRADMAPQFPAASI